MLRPLAGRKVNNVYKSVNWEQPEMTKEEGETMARLIEACAFTQDQWVLLRELAGLKSRAGVDTPQSHVKWLRDDRWLHGEPTRHELYVLVCRVVAARKGIVPAVV